MALTTTPGALLIESMLPDSAKPHFQHGRVLDKNGVKDLMINIIKNGGDDAHKAISDISHLFFNTATDKGFSTPLSDYDNDSEERRALVREFETKVAALQASNKSKDQKDRELFEIVTTYTQKIRDQNLKYMVGKGSTAAKMAMTGARGNPDQLRQGTASPLMARDISGAFIPIPIKKSFAEGLTPAEHIAMSYEGRGNTVKTQNSTSLPGAIFKHITPNLYHEVVTMDDCKTTNGIVVPIEDKKALLGRYLAGSNVLVDERTYKSLKDDGKASLKVRNAITCEAPEGLCQKCYGIAHTGSLPHIGENVGVLAAQSVSEVLTQAMLSTKHSSGAGRKRRDTYEETSNLLHNPENFQDEATVAKLNGKVDRIEQTALKDHKVFIDGVEHFVPVSQDLTVKVGDSVHIGDAISTGTINPRTLVELRGIGAGRRYLSSQLRKVYDDGLDTRHFDIVAKNMIKYVQVKDPGKTGLLPGQKVDIKHITPHLRDNVVTTPLAQAEGRTLAGPALELVPGTVLDKNHIHYLANHGVKEVQVAASTLKVAPLVPGLTTAKLLDKNWVSRLAFNRIQTSLQEAAAEGHESPIHSTDPVASYLMGSEFGLGENGRY